MASRVTKSPNATGIEFASAGAPLHIAELDADLDAIFGGITNGNIAPGAAIATSKLATDGGITSGMLASNSVTSPKLVDGAVTLLKIATGASVFQSVFVAVSSGTVVGAGDTVVATLPTFTPRGGRVVLFGTISGSAVLPAGGGGSVIAKVKRGITTINDWGSGTGLGGVAVTIPFWMPILATEVPPANALAAYTVTVAWPGVAGTFSTDGARPGTIFAVELA